MFFLIINIIIHFTIKSDIRPDERLFTMEDQSYFQELIVFSSRELSVKKQLRFNSDQNSYSFQFYATKEELPMLIQNIRLGLKRQNWKEIIQNDEFNLMFKRSCFFDECIPNDIETWDFIHLSYSYTRGFVTVTAFFGRDSNYYNTLK